MMDAMIFAAGLGTRLKPLTETCPKALVKVQNKTLLQHNIEKLIDAGVKHIVINVHHHAEMLINYISKLSYDGVNIIISDERDELLDTGGGLKKAASLFSSHQPIIVQNVDILSGIDYTHLLQHHQNQKALATLAVRKRESSRQLLFNKNMELKGWQNTKTAQIKHTSSETNNLETYAFSGIQIVSPEIFQFFPDEPVFSIIDYYLKLAKVNRIVGYRHQSDFWYDIGSPEKLNSAELFFREGKDELFSKE